MPSKKSKDFVNLTLTKTLRNMHQVLSDKPVIAPPAKRQKVDEVKGSQLKQSDISMISRELCKQGHLAIGLKESLKAVSTSIDQKTQKTLAVFILHDKEHESSNSQVMSACRQSGINHYVLPKFSKVELCKLFNIKRVTTFVIMFDGLPQSMFQEVEQDLSQFNQLLAEGKADINQFRYADDSMFISRPQNEFRNTQIKKWTVEIHPKNYKKTQRELGRIRSKSEAN